jgi:transcriptional regulator with XRE-family HTH domain
MAANMPYRGTYGKGFLCPTGVLAHYALSGHQSAMRNNIATLRKRAGLSQTELAERIGTSINMLGKLERGSRDITGAWIEKLANVLRVQPGEIVGEGGVPVVGKIGAGGSIIYEDVGNTDFVSRPPDTRGELVGLEVEGDSMMPKFDPGDVIYISRDYDGVSPELVGSYCAVRLTTGETYLKILARGQAFGLWTLRSLNAADMENRELLWATPVRAILPRQSRRY